MEKIALQAELCHKPSAPTYILVIMAVLLGPPLVCVFVLGLAEMEFIYP